MKRIRKPNELTYEQKRRLASLGKVIIIKSITDEEYNREGCLRLLKAIFKGDKDGNWTQRNDKF